MKRTGTIASVKRIEELIKGSGMDYTIMDNGPNSKQVQGKEFNSNAFSILYEVYPMPIAHKLKEIIPSIIKWAAEDTVHIRFWYDYRRGAASIKVNNYSMDKVSKVIPIFPELVSKINFRQRR
ncbi:hypothetical protein ES704_01387 [subsurface metagenome]|jgi:hypothetical protein